MPKRLVLFLLIVSFVAGFMIHEMLFGISGQGEYLIDNTNSHSSKNQDSIAFLGPSVEIIKLQNPPKALRGASFEVVAYLKFLRRSYEKYNLAVFLFSLDGKTKLACTTLTFDETKELLLGKTIRIGPFNIPLPEGLELGKYRIAACIFKDEKELADFKVENIESQNQIEVISIN